MFRFVSYAKSLVFIARKYGTTFRKIKYVKPLLFGTSLAISWPFSKKAEMTVEEKTAGLMKSAMYHARNANFKAAEDDLHEILMIFAKSNPESPETNEEIAKIANRRAKVFSELANIRLLQNDIQGASVLFLQTMKDCIVAGVREGHPMIVEISMKLAVIYSQLNDRAKAESGFDFCLTEQRKNCENIPNGGKLDDEDLNKLGLLGLVSNTYAQ